MLAIKAGNLIDGTGRAVKDQVVLVEGERIQRVGPAQEIELDPAWDLIDAGAATLMPGMVDAHVHIRGNGTLQERAAQHATSLGTLAFRSFVNAHSDLEAGFTALRDCGSTGYVNIALRDAIDAGQLEGPRIKAPGYFLNTSGRPGGLPPTLRVETGMTGPMLPVDDPDAARKAARYEIKMGADFIKIAATLTDYVRAKGLQCSQELTFETMQAICQTAHWMQRPVAAHCHGGQGVTDAILAGVNSLEHGRFLSDEQLDMMAERGVFLVPTLSPEGRAMEAGREAAGLIKDENWNWFCMANGAMYDTVARAHRKGVKVAMGSDAAMPLVHHGDNAYEMELFVRAGMTPMEAIVSATKVAAEVLGMANEIGTIEAGKLADLVIVDGDPLADIKILQNLECIKKVLKGGKVVVERP